MTTRSLLRTELQQAIRRELETDKDLSERQVISRLRRQGLRGGNQALRAQVKLERARLNAGNIRLGSPQQDLDDLSLTLDIGVGGRQSRIHVLRQAGATTRPPRRGRGQPQFAAINYFVTYRAAVYFYGQRQETISGELRGRVVQDLEHYNREDIETRIEQQVMGRIMRTLSDENESYIEGVDIELEYLDVAIETLELRGGRG